MNGCLRLTVHLQCPAGSADVLRRLRSVLDVVEGHIEVDELEGGREPGDASVVADSYGDLDLDRGCPPAADRDDGAVRAHAGVDEIPDDGVIKAEDLLDRRGVLRCEDP